MVGKSVDALSSDAVPDFVSMLERIKDENSRNLPIVIVGNKVDLEEDREVSTAEGAAYARLIGAEFVEVSAMTRVNIQKVRLRPLLCDRTNSRYAALHRAHPLGC